MADLNVLHSRATGVAILLSLALAALALPAGLTAAELTDVGDLEAMAPRHGDTPAPPSLRDPPVGSTPVAESLTQREAGEARATLSANPL